MPSEEPPPMPAAPPPSSEPPPAAPPIPPAPTPTSGPLVDRVPGAGRPPEPAGLILPSDLPTWAPAPAERVEPAPPAQEFAPQEPAPQEPAPQEPAPQEPAPDEPAEALPAEAATSEEPAFDAGDTIPVSSFLAQFGQGATDEVSQPELPQPEVPQPEAPQSEVAQPGWAEETQAAWPAGMAAPPAPPPSPAPEQSPFPAPPSGFAPPGFVPPPSYSAGTEPATVFGARPGGPPAGQPPGATPTAHRATPPGGGRGRLAAIVAAVVVLLAALGGGAYAIFHSGSSHKATISAPATSPTGAPPAPSAVTSPSAAPTSAAPSPTADRALGGMQAKMLQSTVIAPLKSLASDDLHVANASDHCVGLTANAKEYSAHVAVRANLLAQLRKLDVTAMQDYKTWKGLLEQVQLTNIKFEQQLALYSRDLAKSCDPSTSTKNTHYKQAVALAKTSGGLQKMFLASYNPVAKLYHVPMQGQGNL